MIKRKLYVVGGAVGYCNWMESQVVDRMEDADGCVFTGGEDCDPGLYGKKPHYTTSSNPYRDAYETKEFNKAKALGLPMIGICRGSQYLCTMNGGLLVQDQDNPRFIHDIYTNDGRKFITSSTHHQCQWPWNLPLDRFKVLAWSIGQSRYHYGETDEDEMVIGKVEDNKECEVVYYPKTRSLGYQGHPEMIFDRRHNDIDIEESIQYCRGLLDGLMNNTL